MAAESSCIAQGERSPSANTIRHDGVFSLRVGDDVVFDLDNGILYNTKGRAGKVAFTENDLIMEFNSLVPTGSLGLIAVLVALDTMWANMVGFTRTKAQPSAPLS